MAARGTNGQQPATAPTGANGSEAGDEHNLRRLHRIQTVRRQQGISLRTAARHLGSNIREIRVQEDEATDLRLSDLYRWQAALDVPLEELLVESERPLSRPVLERAKLVQVMKTAAALRELAPNTQVARLATRLVDQLIELMPELKEVAPWHSVGQRRAPDEFGEILRRRIPAEFFDASSLDNED
jgi:transcriptional regulator with XRE-family HTH domain